MKRRISATRRWQLLVLALIGAQPLSASANERGSVPGDFVFRDSLEIQVDQVWRSFSLRLLDPHVFTDVPLVGCFDFTDNPIPLAGISLNGEIANALVSDSDGDTFLDLSPLTVVDRLAPSSPGQMMGSLPGQCASPAPPANCQLPVTPISLVPASNLNSGECLQALPGTTSGYTPAVMPVPADCFVTDATTQALDLNGISITLVESRSAASWVMQGDMLSPGLMRGFLSETEADQILLPADLPLIGGQPLSALLPGGAQNCAAGDDRDMLMGESGWWFYLSFEAEQVDAVNSP